MVLAACLFLDTSYVGDWTMVFADGIGSEGLHIGADGRFVVSTFGSQTKTTSSPLAGNYTVTDSAGGDAVLLCVIAEVPDQPGIPRHPYRGGFSVRKLRVVPEVPALVEYATRPYLPTKDIDAARRRLLAWQSRGH